jgi:hypothetical protein
MGFSGFSWDFKDFRDFKDFPLDFHGFGILKIRRFPLDTNTNEELKYLICVKVD